MQEGGDGEAEEPYPLIAVEGMRVFVQVFGLDSYNVVYNDGGKVSEQASEWVSERCTFTPDLKWIKYR